MSTIAVLGAGVVGTNLAQAFATLGHSVRFGARDVASDKVRAALSSVPGSNAMSIDESVAGADLVVLAVPYQAITDTVSAIADLSNVVVIDATNAVGVALEEGTDHAVDLVHAVHPGATVVKAFNTIGAEAYLNPAVGDRSYFLPIAGPEPAASTVRELAAEMGFDAIVIGGYEAVALLESHAQLWIHLAFRTGLGRAFGFVLSGPNGRVVG